jgi:hypothetical protein
MTEPDSSPDGPLAHLDHDGEGHFMAPAFLLSARKVG